MRAERSNMKVTLLGIWNNAGRVEQNIWRILRVSVMNHQRM